MNMKPDPAFVSALEWQLRAELRREPRTRPAWGGRALWAVGALGALLGAASMAAAAHVRERRDGEEVIARLELRTSAAKRAAEFAGSIREREAERRSAGRISAADLRRIESRVAEITMNAALASLDLAEARLSMRPPRTDLAAPLVSGRDFVAERLAVEATMVESMLARRHSEASEVRASVDAGIVPADRLVEVELALRVDTRTAELIRERQAVRRAFVAGEWTVAEVESQDLILGIQARLAVAQGVFDAAKDRAERASRLASAGLISSGELAEAEMSRANAEADLEMLNAELAAATGR